MFNHYTVKARLLLLISFMSIVAISLSFLGLYVTKQANDGLKTVYADRVIPLRDLKIIADMYAVNIVDTTHKVRNGNISWEMAIKNVDDAEKTINQKWDAYLATFLIKEEKDLVVRIKPLMAEANPKIQNLKAILKNHDESGVKDFSINDLYPTIDPLSTVFSLLIDVQLDVAKQEYEEAQSLYLSSLIISILALILGLVLAVRLGIKLINRLMNELGGEPSYAALVVRDIADGNLSLQVVLEPHDKSSLLYSIDKMRKTLSNIIISTNIVMEDTAHGNLSSRMEGTYKGEFIQLQKGINASLEKINETLHDVMTVSNAIAKGDLSQKITQNYSGVFGETKESINETSDVLSRLVGEIQSVIYMGGECGNFGVKIKTDDKVGYGKLLAESINRLFDTTERSLNDVFMVADALSKGDLTQSIQHEYAGIFGEMKDRLNTTVANLQNLIEDIKDTSDIIASASKELSSGNNDLSSRTEQQASSLQQTASSMEELSKTVKQNTDNAKNANKLVLNAASTAQNGLAVMGGVVKTMSSINESSHQIVDIISVIDDIAFQTNILALNAAVEAARAGEQGIGFAVVAIEVRTLAQRAANAAGEIKRLIGDSVERVSEGGKLVENAGDTMQHIVDSIREVTHLMSDIATASIEQNVGIEQIHEAIVEIDTVTQQNASLVEEAAAATKSLSEQTRNLAVEMLHFKTKSIRHAFA
jgi:methyl-accepting chemotaxis protein